MQDIYIKYYISKLPYVGLMLLANILAGSVVQNSSWISQALMSVMLAHLVILCPDFFCFFPKEDELNIGSVILSSIIMGSMVTVGLAVLGLYHMLPYNDMRCFLLIMYSVFFPLIVEKSRYTD